LLHLLLDVSLEELYVLVDFLREVALLFELVLLGVYDLVERDSFTFEPPDIFLELSDVLII
jgi:hypothetical protein